MAKKQKKTTKPAQKSGAVKVSSAAGKRTEQGSKAAQTAPSKAPVKGQSAPMKRATPAANKGAGQKSKSTSLAKERTQSSEPKDVAKNACQRSEPKPKADSNVGKVYRGRTKYIDIETKPERNYVVVVDDGKKVSVAKLKSIKIFDADGKNADKALVEINATRYGLEKRTGVDFQVFGKNRMSGKPLQLDDKDVFPEEEERFKLGSHDLNRTLVHTRRALRGKKKRGK